MYNHLKTICDLVKYWDALNTATEYDESAIEELDEYSKYQVRILNGYNYILKDKLPCTISTVKDIVMLVRTAIHGVAEYGDTVTDNKYNSSLTTTLISLDVLLATDIQIQEN